MKQKILIFILGILIGAVVTAGCFLIFAKPTQGHKMNGNRMEMGNFVPGDKTNENGRRKSQNTVSNDTQSTETTDSTNTTNANS